MKNLANCKPSEFLIQTNKIRKSVEKWFDVTDIANIRKRIPDYTTAPDGATAEERKKVIEENAEKERKQAKENLSAILDEMLENHPQETVAILAQCCFIEPEDADNHSMIEYIGALNDLLNSKEVLDFFILLVKLGRTNI